MKTSFPSILALLALVILFSSCAENTPVNECLPGDPYNFWGGLWHGFIAPFDLIAMLFKDNVTVFAQNNNGFWYTFGFLLGSGGWGLLGGHGASKARRK